MKFKEFWSSINEAKINVGLIDKTNGIVDFYIDNKKYSYQLDPAKLNFLANKYNRKPGKFFNEVKKIGTRINN